MAKHSTLKNKMPKEIKCVQIDKFKPSFMKLIMVD